MTRAAESLLRRSPLPLVWLAGAVGVVSASALAPAAAGVIGPREITDTYYVVVHRHFSLSLPVVFVLMAGIYAALDFVRFQYRRAFAWWHFALMLLGSCLILAPAVLFASAVRPQRFLDPVGLFTLLSRISGAGYGVMIVATAIFAVLVIDAVVRMAGQR